MSAPPAARPTCRFPDCERPVRKPKGTGAKPRYCDLTDERGRYVHTPLAKHRAEEKARRAAADATAADEQADALAALAERLDRVTAELEAERAARLALAAEVERLRAELRHATTPPPAATPAGNIGTETGGSTETRRCARCGLTARQAVGQVAARLPHAQRQEAWALRSVAAADLETVWLTWTGGRWEPVRWCARCAPAPGSPTWAVCCTRCGDGPIVHLAGGATRDGAAAHLAATGWQRDRDGWRCPPCTAAGT